MHKAAAAFLLLSFGHPRIRAGVSRWLATRAEEAGAYILTETSAHQLLVTDGAVRGIRSGDKGRGKDGQELSNFEPGSDVTARATVLAEGTWGHLTGPAIKEFTLAASREPQVWALGVKEVWEVSEPLDRVIHTLGWPLRYGAKWHEFGGSWIYPQGENRVSIGFVVGLDLHRRHRLAPRPAPAVQDVEAGPWNPRGRQTRGLGREGDPRGRLLGDAQALGAGHGDLRRQRRDGQRAVLKGIHYAIHSGILAAETIFNRLKDGGTDLSEYDRRVEESVIGKELLPVAQHEATVQPRVLPRRRDHQRNGDQQGAVPGRRGPTTAMPTRA